MRIGLDLTTCQFAGARRGNGRYGAGLATALVKGYPDITWVLLCHQSRFAATNTLPPILREPNVEPAWMRYHGGDASLVVDAFMRGALASGEVRPNPARLDALLVISPFESIVPCKYPGVRTASVFYDAVPIRCRARYEVVGYAVDEWAQHLQLLRNHDHVFAISESARQDLLDLGGVDSARTSVIHGGVDSEFFALPKEPFIQPRIVSVIDKHPNTRKGAIPLVKFLATLPIDFQLWMVGAYAPTTMHACYQLALELGCADRLVFTGEIPDKVLRSLYQTSAAYVGMSEWEGLYLPAIEAQLCGCPALVPGNSSHPEVVPQIHPQEKWVNLIISPRNNSIDYRSHVREWAKAKFQWSSTAAKVMEVLNV